MFKRLFVFLLLAICALKVHSKDIEKLTDDWQLGPVLGSFVINNDASLMLTTGASDDVALRDLLDSSVCIENDVPRPNKTSLLRHVKILHPSRSHPDFENAWKHVSESVDDDYTAGEGIVNCRFFNLDNEAMRKHLEVRAPELYRTVKNSKVNAKVIDSAGIFPERLASVEFILIPDGDYLAILKFNLMFEARDDKLEFMDLLAKKMLAGWQNSTLSQNRVEVELPDNNNQKIYKFSFENMDLMKCTLATAGDFGVKVSCGARTLRDSVIGFQPKYLSQHRRLTDMIQAQLDN